ncbi:hypothetical protein SBADM41S_12321 [Streptomyces badius]
MRIGQERADVPHEAVLVADQAGLVVGPVVGLELDADVAAVGRTVHIDHQVAYRTGRELAGLREVVAEAEVGVEGEDVDHRAGE